MHRNTSLATLERRALLPAASATPTPMTCRRCDAPFDAFDNRLYRCTTCDELFCHRCVPLQRLKSSYARLCHRCYKNIRGISRGAALELPPPDVASKLGDLFNWGTHGSKQRPEAQPVSQSEEQDIMDRDVAAYMMLPTHVLESILEFLIKEEERQVEAMSKWYDRKRRNVNRKIDAMVTLSASTSASCAVAPDGGSSRTNKAAPLVRRPSARRQSTVQDARVPRVESTELVDVHMSTPTTSMPREPQTDSVAAVTKKKKKPVPIPRRDRRVADADHPFHADLASEWLNPLADPMATLRGTAVLSSSDGDLWLHRGLSRDKAEDILLERDRHGSWLVRAQGSGSAHDVVELLVDSGTGAPSPFRITRNPAGYLCVDGTVVGTAGTLRSLVQELCCGESDTDADTGLPTLSFDDAVLSEESTPMSSGVGGWMEAVLEACHASNDTTVAASVDTAIHVDTTPTAPRAHVPAGHDEPCRDHEHHETVTAVPHTLASLAVGPDEDDSEEDETLETSAGAWIASINPALVHRGCSESDAESLLAAVDRIGSWVLRVVLPDEAWGNAVEAEMVVDQDGRGGETMTYRVTQCLDTGRLVVDGVPLRDMDSSLAALCDHLGLDLTAGLTVTDNDDGLASSLEWDPVHEGLSLDAAQAAVVANRLSGSWLIRVPGLHPDGVDLIVYTGSGPPLCLPLRLTERDTLTFDTSNATTRLPEGEFADLDELIDRLTTPDKSQPPWLDLERAVPIWAIVSPLTGC
eukprot:m.55999 g.55999  ORF g.55999 m.55999 type:complete len:751 (-) comp7645_c0_seq2:1272-3524(-)